MAVQTLVVGLVAQVLLVLMFQPQAGAVVEPEDFLDSQAEVAVAEVEILLRAAVVPAGKEIQEAEEAVMLLVVAEVPAPTAAPFQGLQEEVAVLEDQILLQALL